MNRLVILAWLLAIGISGTALLLSAHNYAQARATAETEQARLQQVATQAREMAALRAGVPAWADRSKADAALAPRAAAVVTSCGLPASVLSNISPEAQTPIGDNQFKAIRQRATITLTAITLPQVGRFLDAWRTTEPDWIITSVDLSPQRSTNITPGGDLPLRAVIVVETIFLNSSPAPPTPHTRPAGGKP